MAEDDIPKSVWKGSLPLCIALARDDAAVPAAQFPAPLWVSLDARFLAQLQAKLIYAKSSASRGAGISPWPSQRCSRTLSRTLPLRPRRPFGLMSQAFLSSGALGCDSLYSNHSSIFITLGTIPSGSCLICMRARTRSRGTLQCISVISRAKRCSLHRPSRPRDRTLWPR